MPPFDPLGLLPSSSSNRLSLPPLPQLFQSLRSNYSGTMQAMPQQQAQTMYPNANLGAGNAGTTGGGTGLPSIPVPGGGSIAPPPVPFGGHHTTTPPATMPQGNGGLLGAANTLLGSVGNTVASLLNPRGAAPVNVPNAPSAPAGGMPTTAPQVAPNGVTSNVLATAANVVRTVAGNLPGVVTPQTATQAPVTTSMPAQQSGPAPQATAAQSMMASNPAPSALAQQAPAASPPQQVAQPALAQQATQVPLAQHGQPVRAETAFAPAGNPAAERAAVPQQAQLPALPALQTAPAATTLLAAVPMANTVAQAPVTQALAGNPQAQAPGVPQPGTAALDAGGPVRAELTGTGTYTAEGPGLRRRERMKVGAQQMGQWILAAAQGRLHLVRPHDDSRHEAERVFQWLFWVLAIVAYGSLGLVLVAFLLSFGELPAAPTLRRWTGEFAFTGLLAAVGAWWLGRQLTRAARPPPDPIRR